MKFKAYQLIERAVEEGVNYGYNRAHKHTDTPTEATLKGLITEAIMSELCDIIDFDTTDDGLICLQEDRIVL